MSTSRRSASRRGVSSSPVTTQYSAENHAHRYVHPRRTGNNVNGRRLSEDFGWAERNLFDVFLVLTKIPLSAEEFEYRDRQHGVVNPPPSTIVTPPRAKATVIGPLPKATAPPHPSKIHVDKIAPTRTFEEESQDPTDGSVGSSIPSSARRGRTLEHSDGSRGGGGGKQSDRSDNSSQSDRTGGSRKSKNTSKERQPERAQDSNKDSHKGKGDRSQRSDTLDKTDKSDELSKKERREKKKKRDTADEDKNETTNRPIEYHEAAARPISSGAENSGEPTRGKLNKSQTYKVACKVGSSKTQKIPFKNNSDLEKTFSVSISDTSIATTKASSVTVAPREEFKLPIKLLPVESPGGKTVAITLLDGKEEVQQAELKITYAATEGN